MTYNILYIYSIYISYALHYITIIVNINSPVKVMWALIGNEPFWPFTLDQGGIIDGVSWKMNANNQPWGLR